MQLTSITIYIEHIHTSKDLPPYRGHFLDGIFTYFISAQAQYILQADPTWLIFKNSEYYKFGNRTAIISTMHSRCTFYAESGCLSDSSLQL